jgi:flagellar biosynthetic protein FlhB
MAKPEQTEKATPKRRSEARKRGQVAKSADLSGAVIFLTIATILHFMLFQAFLGAAHMVHIALDQPRPVEDPTIDSASNTVFAIAHGAIFPMGVLFGITVIVSILINVLQVGFTLTLQPLKPNFSRLNPIAGIQRLFSAQSIVNLAKQIFKMSILCMLIYQAINGNIGEIYSLSEESPLRLVHFVDDLLFSVSIRFGFFLLGLGMFDYFWERHRLAEMLKMTKTEVKDETRQQEGSSEAKGVFKRRQREIARKRMMTAVPTATVIITNPTHFAVALKWDEEKMAAPVLVAKGADLMAKRIRDLGRQHEIPLIENPPLARALYRDVPLDTPIPAELYSAVAKVIAFVFALRARPTKENERAARATLARLGATDIYAERRAYLIDDEALMPPAK